MRSKRQQWQLLTEHFDRLIELPEEQWDGELQALAESDPDLAEQVRAMLKADRDDSTILRGGSAISSPGAAQALVEKLVPGHEQTDPWPHLGGDARRRIEPPERIGPYRLVERLGIGGMGEVWRGERADGGFEQMVAIKLVAFQGRGLAERFDLERRILARLQHPGIACLYDGGQTPTGLPYLVMEYVEGLPITEHVAQSQPELEQLLQLMIEICEAVDHAHRLMVVHRDLKPSNVLVNASGQIKLLDFGIAKLLDEDAPALTLGEGQPMTPLYAAPEQVRGEPVSAVSDVYALGVILYQLLTGAMPTAREGVPLTTLAEVVSSETIEPPSRVVSTLHGHGRWNASALRGDLDLVVVTALHSDPSRRYRSAAALGEDLDRLLRGLPIRARPDNWRYRVSKFLRRHRYAAGGIALALLSLAVGFSAALWQAQRAREAAAQAERALAQSERSKQFLVDLIGTANPLVSEHGSKLDVRTLLLDAAERLQTELAEDPAAQAELKIAIGANLQSLGESAQALTLLQSGLAQMRSILGDESAAVANAWMQLGRAQQGVGDLASAESAERRALALFQRLPGDQRAMLISVRTSLAKLAGLRGDAGAALDQHQAILADRMAWLGANDPALAVDYNNTAAQLVALGRYAEAEAAYNRAYQLLRERFGEQHPRLAFVVAGQAACAIALGQLDQAQQLVNQGLRLAESALAPNHELQGSLRLIQARVFLEQGRAAEAEQAGRQALAIYAASSHPHIVNAATRLALALARQSKWDQVDDLVALARPVAARLPAEPQSALAALISCRDYARGEPAAARHLSDALDALAAAPSGYRQVRVELLGCAIQAATESAPDAVESWRARLAQLQAEQPGSPPSASR